MSVTVCANNASPTPDYVFCSPEGLLEMCNHRVLVVESTNDRDYLSGLALLLGLKRKVFSQAEWDVLPLENTPVFKWFVDMGEFSQ